MFTRLAATAALLILSTIAAERAEAQAAAADVTFDVPVNLTRLPSDITRIKLHCEVGSVAIDPGYGATQPRGRRWGEVEIPVQQGEIVTTAQVVVPISTAHLDSPSGKQATYECRVAAFHQSPQTSPLTSWHDLHNAQSGDAACRLTPRPAPITGSFVW
ncbi:MAG: hypothetical protein ACRETY_00695 [Steroidobacteraceae bacterium]